MAAGMHHIGRARSIGQVVGLGDRQRVHVGAQADLALRAATLQRRHHPMAADIRGERHAEFGQLFLHEGARHLLMPAEFRMGMQMPAPGCQGFVQVAIQGRHPSQGQKGDTLYPATARTTSSNARTDQMH
jgi:hypothetical protein